MILREYSLILAVLQGNDGHRMAAVGVERGIGNRTLYYRLTEYERKGLLG